jgi:hypothetical protein
MHGATTAEGVGVAELAGSAEDVEACATPYEGQLGEQGLQLGARGGLLRFG